MWHHPARGAAALLSFARAERASMLELVLAATHTQSPRRAALYLRHAADERRHARMFAGRAVSMGAEDTSSVASADEHALFTRLGEAGFLAFVHHGERRGVRQLGAHRRYFAAHADERMGALFDAVLEDEHRHVAYSWEELVAETGGLWPARRALGRAATLDAWLAYRRVARGFGSRLFRVSMAAVYLLGAPLTWMGRSSRRTPGPS